MKSLYLGLVLGLVPGAGLSAQETSAPPAEPPVETAAVPAMTEEQLRELMGPVALYPDALIALILPAATEPSDVVLASRFVATKPTDAQIDAQPWSDSLKGLARYPDVLAWMDTNLAWTRQVGDQFVAQPAGVMNAVQALRAQARAAGTLTDTPQQRVVVEQQIIRIEPARAEVIYVPVYDPAIVYVRRAPVYTGSVITFSTGYPTGVWLAYSCDWGRSSVWVVGSAYRTPYYHRTPAIVYTQRNPPPGYHRWTPPASRPRPAVVINRNHPAHSNRPDNAMRAPLTPGVGGSTRRSPDGVWYPQPGYTPTRNRPFATTPSAPSRVDVAPVRPTPALQAPAPAPGRPQAPRIPREPGGTQGGPRAPSAPRTPVVPGAPAAPTPRAPAPIPRPPGAQGPQQPSTRFEQRTMPPSRITPPAGQNGQRRSFAPAPAPGPAATLTPMAPGATTPVAPGGGNHEAGGNRRWRGAGRQ